MLKVLRIIFYISALLYIRAEDLDNANDKTEQGDNLDNGFSQFFKTGLDLDNWKSFQQIADKGDLAGYFSNQQAEEIIKHLSEKLPELFLPVEVIGKSYENKDIKMHCITRKNGNTTLEEEAQNKAIGLVTALHHPREPMSLSMLMFLLFRILSEYSQNKEEYVSLLGENIICFIPTVNIDGYNHIIKNYKETGKFLHVRKNRNNEVTSSGHCKNDIDVGVDLNRNYDYGWDINDEGSSPNQCQEDYRGPSPFSEPETKAIRDLVEKYKSSLKVAINLHAYGNLWIFPFNCYKDDTNYKAPRIKSILQDFATKAPLPKGHLVGNAISTVEYTANGEASDWLLGKYGIIAISPEIGIKDEGANMFLPNKKLIYSVVETDFPGVFYLLSKLNFDIKLQAIDEKHLENMNNYKTIYMDLFNGALQDISEAKIRLNLTIQGLQKPFLEITSAPEIYLVQNDMDNKESYNTIPIDMKNVDPVFTKGSKSMTYFASQSSKFKSWNVVQLQIIIPFGNYAGGHVDVQVVKNDKEIFSFSKDFEGMETITNSTKLYILIIALLVSALITVIIICATQYYLKKGKGAQNGNMFGKSQPPGLEFAQIEENSDLE